MLGFGKIRKVTRLLLRCFELKLSGSASGCLVLWSEMEAPDVREGRVAGYVVTLAPMRPEIAGARAQHNATSSASLHN